MKTARLAAVGACGHAGVRLRDHSAGFGLQIASGKPVDIPPIVVARLWTLAAAAQLSQ